MKYSIITINFNNREGLRKTIESVVNQTYKDFEYIIIDGGSTDGSVEVIKEYADKIDYWVSESDKGIYNAMNKGILQAHGEYLNFMNSGDCFYNEKVLDELLPHLKVEVLFGKSYMEQTNSYWEPRPPMSLFHICLYGVNHQAVFYRRMLFENHLYDETYFLVSDWKFTIEKVVLEQHSYACVETVIAKYDLSGISSSNRQLVIQERNAVLASILPPGISDDYRFFSQLRTPLLEEIPFWVQHHTLHKWIVRIIHLMTNLYKGLCFLLHKKY